MDILWKSGLAAVVTALILGIEKIAGPKIAGAIGGLPIVFAISFLLITHTGRDAGQIGSFLFGGIVGALSGVLFCLLLWGLTLWRGEWYWLNFVVSYAVCFVVAFFTASLSGRG